MNNLDPERLAQSLQATYLDDSKRDQMRNKVEEHITAWRQLDDLKELAQRVTTAAAEFNMDASQRSAFLYSSLPTLPAQRQQRETELRMYQHLVLTSTVRVGLPLETGWNRRDARRRPADLAEKIRSLTAQLDRCRQEKAKIDANPRYFVDIELAEHAYKEMERLVEEENVHEAIAQVESKLLATNKHRRATEDLDSDEESIPPPPPKKKRPKKH